MAKDAKFTARPTAKPIDVDAGYERAMRRFPRIMARLAEGNRD